jgi:hypothetical protein
MLTADELLRKAEDYRQMRISLEEFEDWFEDNSAEAYEDSDLKELWAAVDGALAEYHYDYIGEAAFREELEAAVHPFALDAIPARSEIVASSTASACEAWKSTSLQPVPFFWAASAVVSAALLCVPSGPEKMYSPLASTKPIQAVFLAERMVL